MIDLFRNSPNAELEYPYVSMNEHFLNYTIITVVNK